jgi:hypothetical protein
VYANDFDISDTQPPTYQEMAQKIQDQQIPKTKLKSKMCRVNYQCVMCGWNFQWPCGDTSGLGETLYNIESVYHNLNREAFAGLFHKPHDSHLVHQHSRNGIDTACTWRNVKHERDMKNKSPEQLKEFQRDDPHFQTEYEKGDIKAFTRRINDDCKTLHPDVNLQNDNLASLVENIYTQMQWVFISVIGVRESLILHTNPTYRIGARETNKWLRTTIKNMSKQNTVNEMSRQCWRDYVHSTCSVCNIAQTREAKFWRVVAATAGMTTITNSKEKDVNIDDTPYDATDDFTPPKISDKSATNTRRQRDRVLALILTYTEIEVKRKLYELYGWDIDDGTVEVVGSDTDNAFEYMSVYINFLTVMNIQTTTMCVQDAASVTGFLWDIKAQANHLKRHLWQTGAALLTTAILHRSIFIITNVAFFRARLQDKKFGVDLELFETKLALEPFWKYVFVECAIMTYDGNPTPYRKRADAPRHTNRRFNMTPYEYIFGTPWPGDTFQRIGAAAYLSKISQVINESLGRITNLMKDPRGTSFMMFSIKKVSPNIEYAMLTKFLRQIPRQMAHSDAGFFPLRTMVATNFLHKNMRIMMTPETEIDKMMLYLVTSSLGDQASPSEVLKSMRAPTNKIGVQRMLRLPHILNDMAPDVPRLTVRLLLERIMFIVATPLVPLR